MKRSWIKEFVFYFGASALALALDFGVLLLAAKYIHYLLAATLGFLAGAFLAYMLSTRLVFERRKLAANARLESLLFVVIGVLGLGINNGAIFLAVEYFSAPLAAAKFFAAGATFLSNFGLRKWLLF